MKAERWQQIDHLLQSALARDPKERPAFLALACADDEPLRREVESLLISHDQSGGLLETPLSQVAADLLVRGNEQCVDGQTIGHYEVLARLGAGAMGEVYLAQDTRLGRKVALKLLPAEFTKDEKRVRRFEQEARAASALNHPNILTIHEIGQTDGLHFIATEFIEGQTLRQRMTGARMTLSETLDVAMQGAGALAAAHEAGIVHRDIKPENIMLRRDGYVKVLDFGLAKLAEGHASTDARAPTGATFETEPGTVMGTAHYMAPEQARGQEVDARTDIFSLGVVLYEMIASRPPFDGATTSDVIAAILKEEPVPLELHSPELPAELGWMVKKALAKDREQRYQTIRELYIDLKRLKQELELLAKLDGISPAGLQRRATGSKSAGQALDDLMREAATHEAVLEPQSGEIKPQQRNNVSRLKAVVVALVAVSIFSLVSFYVGLKRAPSPTTPTFRQLTYRRGIVTRARFAPDGQTIIYSAAFEGKPLELFTLDPENLESSPFNLLGGERVAGIQAISSTGEMAILLDCEHDWGNCTDGILARVDVSGGSPQEIVGLENVYDADWSPDGKDLAIVRGVEGEYQLEYPVGKVLYKAPGRIINLRVSPSGDQVAFIDQPSLNRWGGSIVLVDRDGKHQTLSTGWKSTSGLAWSPAGDEVWFCGSRGGVLAIHAVTTSGRERLVFEAPGNVVLHDISRTGRILIHRGVPFSRMVVGLTADSEKERDLSLLDWSTSADISVDGKNLLFYEWGMAVGYDPVVYLRTMDGSKNPVRVGQGKALSLSPDGNWALALQESTAQPQQLVLLPTGGGEPSFLPRGDISEYLYASWFPDGKRILFTGLEPGHALRSYSQETPSGEPKAITDEGTVALSVLPDGKRFLASAPDRGLVGTFYLDSFDRTKSTTYAPIRGLELGDIPIRLSADASVLYVRSPGNSRAGIFRVDLSSGRRDLLKEIVPDPVGLADLQEQPGGIQITPDGKSYVYTYWTVLRDLFLVEGLR
jgi:eukaryotic-like serine/threonine-protein kinase